MIKLLNNNVLELRPHCGHNCEYIVFAIRTILNYIEFGIIRKPIGLIMSKSTQLKTPSNSRGFRRGSNSTPCNGNIRDYANINQLICLSNMENLNAVFINKGMPQRERLIELNKIAIQQMKVLEGVEERRMLK